ncbi:MAG: hypothetical protein VX463_06330, partial [Pseudomonadota bacterium]|nr:hypothetical protein [Pseudomonadota bacterium]
MTDKKKPDEAPEAQAPEAPAPEARSGAGGGKPWPETPEDPESGSAALPEASEPVDAEFSDETPAAPESEIPDPAAPDPAAPGIVEEAGDGDGYPRRDSVGDDVDDAGSSELAAGLDSGSDLPASETAEPDDALAPHAAGHDYEDHPAEDEPEHDDQARPSLAARALQALVILLVGAAIALWALPRVAPMLPAPVAEALAPVHEVSEADLTALRADLEARIAALETAAPAAPDLGPVTARLEDFGARLDALEGAGGGDAPAGAADLGEANQAAISSLRAELEQMSATLAELGSLPPEAAAPRAPPSHPAAGLAVKVDAHPTRRDPAEARFD